MNKIIEMNNVAVNYGNIKALKGVSLSVNEGEIVSLIGANGAGKSTLLKAIVGLEPLVGGEILFKGEKIATSKKETKKKFFGKKIGLSSDKIISRGISLSPEGRGVFADMTILENLEMGAFLVKDKVQIQKDLKNKFEMFPILYDRRKQKAGSLSGGEQQMLSIARALMSRPKLLLLDEPALGLAPIIIQNIFDLIVKISKEQKLTIFLVEQNAKMALTISSRGYVMETGNIVMENNSIDLLHDPKVKAAYLGE